MSEALCVRCGLPVPSGTTRRLCRPNEPFFCREGTRLGRPSYNVVMGESSRDEVEEWARAHDPDVPPGVEVGVPLEAVPLPFLKYLLEQFVEFGLEHGRTDVQIRGLLMEQACAMGVKNVEEILKLAFEE